MSRARQAVGVEVDGAAEQDVRPWAIYARISRATDGSLEGVERQVELCTDYARARGLGVGATFVDNKLSAWKKGVSRPQWDALMERAGVGEFAGILVYAVDRFTRRPKDLESLIELADEHGVAIDGPRSGRLDLTTATGRQQARWMALQAAAESDNTGERVRAAHAQLMRNGKALGPGHAYGFKADGMTPKRAEAKVIREVARRMLKGESNRRIAEDLTRRGIRLPTGNAFTSEKITNVMRRPRNAGLIFHQGKVVGHIPGTPILDEATYDAVMAIVASRRRGRPYSGRFLLTGIARCGHCQRTVNGVTLSVRGVRRPHYRCKGCQRSIVAAGVDSHVRGEVLRLLADPKNLGAIAEKAAALSQAKAQAAEAVDTVEEQLADLEAKYAAGDIVRRAYERARPILDRRLAKAHAALNSARQAVTAPTVDPATDWDALSTDRQRAIIVGLGLDVVIGDPVANGPRFSPERVKVTRKRR